METVDRKKLAFNLTGQVSVKVVEIQREIVRIPWEARLRINTDGHGSLYKATKRAMGDGDRNLGQNRKGGTDSSRVLNWPMIFI